MEEKLASIKTFEELVAWQRAKRLRKSLSIFCKTLPANELYRLKDQILRASQSVTANIAEGYVRFHYKKNIQYCRQAGGSLYEIIDYLDCAKDEEYLSESEFNSYKSEIISCVQLVNSYISYLQRSKSYIVKKSSVVYPVNE
jgi:four helix bundle protein